MLGGFPVVAQAVAPASDAACGLSETFGHGARPGVPFG